MSAPGSSNDPPKQPSKTDKLAASVDSISLDDYLTGYNRRQQSSALDSSPASIGSTRDTEAPANASRGPRQQGADSGLQALGSAQGLGPTPPRPARGRGGLLASRYAPRNSPQQEIAPTPDQVASPTPSRQGFLGRSMHASPANFPPRPPQTSLFQRQTQRSSASLPAHSSASSPAASTLVIAAPPATHQTTPSQVSTQNPSSYAYVNQYTPQDSPGRPLDSSAIITTGQPRPAIHPRQATTEQQPHQQQQQLQVNPAKEAGRLTRQRMAEIQRETTASRHPAATFRGPSSPYAHRQIGMRPTQETLVVDRSRDKEDRLRHWVDNEKDFRTVDPDLSREDRAWVNEQIGIKWADDAVAKTQSYVRAKHESASAAQEPAFPKSSGDEKTEEVAEELETEPSDGDLLGLGLGGFQGVGKKDGKEDDNSKPGGGSFNLLD